MQVFASLGLDLGYIVIILAVFIIVLGILLVVLSKKISNLRKKYNTFMQGEDGKNLESSILSKFAELDLVKENNEKNSEKINNIVENLNFTYQKSAIHKFDAFKEMGGKLSFSLCLLTKEDDGFLLTSMHSSSEGCYTYIKEIIRGESYIVLGEEEKKVLQEAKNSHDMIL